MQSPAPTRRIAAPRPPDPPAPYRFPVVASVAPLGVALVLWLVTGSAFVLLFAVLGPVMALGSFADSRWGARRVRRAEADRFAAELERARDAIAAAHDEERRALQERFPAADALTGRDPGRWQVTGQQGILVPIGLGDVHSELQADESLDGHTVRRAPVVVDARPGIGVCGPPVLAAAVARALAVQVARSVPPDRWWCSGADDWLVHLPHRTLIAPQGLIEFGVDEMPSVTLAWASTESGLPRRCATVVDLATTDTEPAMLTAEAALAWAEAVTLEARSEGMVLAGGAPRAVPLADLLGVSSPGALCCAAATDDSGAPVMLDLVTDGPHAVIAGTTGSGKSELLVSWVLAMAAAAGPDAVNFLLVDFKGGSAFTALAALPHTVGIVTDLDETEAVRALASLRAELRHRERLLAGGGARDVTEVAAARLVIVVDEFAAMLEQHPDLHALFADIAARGRALGVHLVLCTQRPSGVVRDAVLANADLRISLRVNNAADSAAIVGTDAAAHLPAAERGTAIITTPSHAGRRARFALSTPADVEQVASRWPASRPPRRPWCAPLPPLVPRESLPVPPSGVPFGLVDLPHQQRQDTVAWIPGEHGHVLVVGAARSGISTALAALAPEAVPSDRAAAWDTIDDLLHGRDRVIAIDDVDALIAGFAPEHRDALVDRLTGLLREGPARGVYLVLGAQRLTSDVQSLASLVPSRLWLRHASKHDLLLAGGDPAGWIADLPPGGGLWRGDRVQVASGPLLDRSGSARVMACGDRPLAIVTSRPTILAARAEGWRVLGPGEELPHGRAAVIGDVDDWQSRWGALSALRPVADLLVDGCAVTDLKALTRSRELPPPLTGLEDVAWRWEPDGRFSRVRLPF